MTDRERREIKDALLQCAKENEVLKQQIERLKC